VAALGAKPAACDCFVAFVGGAASHQSGVPVTVVVAVIVTVVVVALIVVVVVIIIFIRRGRRRLVKTDATLRQTDARKRAFD